MNIHHKHRIDEDDIGKIVSRIEHAFSDSKINESRKEYNIKTLKMLMEVCEKHPELRLGQILVNIESVNKCPIDPFYEEPIDMYERFHKALVRLHDL